MDIGDRIKLVREYLDLSQSAFGEKISLERSAISLIERKQRNATERCIKDICREFNVDYMWITTGNGEMFTNIPETLLDELVIQYNLDDLDKSIIHEYLKLDTHDRTVIKNYLKNIFTK